MNAPVKEAVKTPRAAALRLLVILGALSAMAPLSTDMYLPALPRLTGDLSTGASLVQLTLTSSLVGLAIGQVLAGPVSDAWGRRRPLLIGTACYAAASLLCTAAPSVTALIAFRLIQGLAGAAAIVISRAMVRDMHAGPAAARYFSLLMLVNGMAPVLAPVIGGQLLRVVSWRGVFVVLAVIGAVLFVAVLAGIAETLPPSDRHTGGLAATARTFAGLCTDRMFAGYALAPALAFAAMFAYISGSPFVIQNIYGLSAQQFSLIFAVNSVGIMAVGQLNAWLVGRIPAGRLLAVGLGASMLGGVLLLAAVLGGAGLWWVLPGLFLVAASIGMTLPNGAALALSSRPPNMAGSASALLGLAQYVIGGAAAPLVGIAGAHTAVPMAIVVAACSCAAAASYAVLTRPSGPSPGPVSCW